MSTTRVFTIREWFKHSRVRILVWYVWLILCIHMWYRYVLLSFRRSLGHMVWFSLISKDALMGDFLLNFMHDALGEKSMVGGWMMIMMMMNHSTVYTSIVRTPSLCFSRKGDYHQLTEEVEQSRHFPYVRHTRDALVRRSFGALEGWIEWPLPSVECHARNHNWLWWRWIARPYTLYIAHTLLLSCFEKGDYR